MYVRGIDVDPVYTVFRLDFRTVLNASIFVFQFIIK
jgi:hypothetical protein